MRRLGTLRRTRRFRFRTLRGAMSTMIRISLRNRWCEVFARAEPVELPPGVRSLTFPVNINRSR